MRAHPKKGGLRCGQSPKKGVLGAGTTRKGGLTHVYNPKKGEFITDFVKRLGTEVAQKGVLGAYLFIIFTFACQYDQLVGCVLAG